MPRKFDLTWDAGHRRWRVMLHGRRHVVSCPQLKKLGLLPEHASETKEASYQAANAWWDRKRAEIDGMQAPHPFRHVISELERRKSWAQKHDPAMAERLQADIKEVGAFTEEDMPLVMAESFYTPASNWAVWHDRFERDGAEPIPVDRTVGGQAKRWLAGQEAKVKAGTMKPGTLRNNSDALRHFRTFLGDSSAVETINEDRLEAYYLFLIGRLGDISRDYGLKCFGTAKAFIRYLVEKGLIPFPKNFESRSFKFNVSAKKIPTLTADEFKLMMRHASGQMPLHLLLMANCGFTQRDIAELRDTEVRWKEGRIVRKRWKTQDQENVPEVDYKLWPETLDLLERHRSGGEIVLRTETGQPWVYERHENGKLKSTDNIASNYKWVKGRIKKRDGVEFTKPLKLIRKTSATMLGGEGKYGLFLAQHFLGHSPRTVATRNYVAPPQDLFDDAVIWLREKYGL